MQTKAESLLSRLPLGLLASPERFYLIAGRLVPWVALAGGLLTAGAVATGLLMEPVDSQQGSAWRIVFVHVPAAWMSLFLYLGMAFFAVLTLALAPGLPAMLMTALAPTGAVFTLIALGTGSLWGKPIWNAWWVWDARLTSELILLLLYIGFLALGSAIGDALTVHAPCWCWSVSSTYRTSIFPCAGGTRSTKAARAACWARPRCPTQCLPACW